MFKCDHPYLYSLNENRKMIVAATLVAAAVSYAGYTLYESLKHQIF